MADLLELSSRIVDSGVAENPHNRVTQELSEVTDDIAVIESFSHVVLVRTGDGLVAFDSSGVMTAGAVVESMRRWTGEPVSHVVYTHGHADHVGGSPAFVADAEARGHRRPVFVGHENVVSRIDRYELTNGWNVAINQRQFGWLRPDSGMTLGGDQRFLPADVARPDVTYRDRHDLTVGGVEMQLMHARGETDDHTWTWLPAQRAACVGDLFIWNFPNAGNPQKVQRYPDEWAAALRAIAAHDPELLLPAHGLPIAGRDRIAGVLDQVATALETLVADVLEAMNSGASLDTILHSVKVDPAVLRLPYLRPLYDEPEFVVRNVWRKYGGWWDGNPASLKPAPESAVAAEVAALAGGADRLVARAGELAAGGDDASMRLACHLIELAAKAAPDDPGVHEARAAVYEQRRRREMSLMTKGIFSSAVLESQSKLDDGR
ncbi:alkyl sulfatase dimerization domain-containing protein [Desertimonas flava]|uniref:alkyl sulfatase dimerization domain-containing protein n=1 Tax=Desertimonas flava TaxID=2064846 RepID=UPI000E34B912|nr:alkyl sulfatase dimerization domain-containing protein [Desertimonas flava]